MKTAPRSEQKAADPADHLYIDYSTGEMRDPESRDYDLEAEQAALGAAMLDAKAAVDVCTELQPSDFYVGLHGTILSAILSLIGDGVDVDIVTVNDHLRRSGVEAVPYVCGLPNACPTAESARHYAGIIKFYSEKRSAAKESERAGAAEW